MVTSCETGPDAWRHQEEIIRTHFPHNHPDFALTENPAVADVILIGNLRSENDYLKLRTHPLLRRWAKKCFVLHDGDDVPRFCQGILTSLTRSRFNFGRFRSASYFLFHPDFKNPFVERWFAERANRAVTPSKEYLACFSGRACIDMRRRLFALRWKREDMFIRDTSNTFDNFTHHPLGKNPERESYFNVAIRSKFMLCPRGDGAASNRFFEAMQLGLAPVLISDDWVLPEGPDWTKCMLHVREDALDTLEETLVQNEARADAIGREALSAYEEFFHGEAYVRFLIGAARSIQRSHTFIPERCFQIGWRPWLLAEKLNRRSRRLLGRYAGRRGTPPRRDLASPQPQTPFPGGI